MWCWPATSKKTNPKRQRGDFSSLTLRVGVREQRKNRGSDSQRETNTQREFRPVTTPIRHEVPHDKTTIAHSAMIANFARTSYPVFLLDDVRLKGICRLCRRYGL